MTEAQRLRHQAFLNDIQAYKRRVRTVVLRSSKSVGIQHYNRAALKRQIGKIRGSGAEPVYVVPPMRVGNASILERHLPAVFAFNDPMTFPTLHRVDRHFDRVHLNRLGAQEFTRFLAERFAAHIAKREGS